MSTFIQKVSFLRAFVVTALATLTLSACDNKANENMAADWQLDTAQSRLNFSSTKNGDIEEDHSFDSITGTINADGQFSLSIDLTSVNTNIDIRDERLKKHLFETEKYPKAIISGEVAPELLYAVDTSSKKITAQLDLSGKTTSVEAIVTTASPNSGTVTVATKEPIKLSAKELGLADGVNTLREIAGLDSISDEVPVTFNLTFKK